MDKLKEALTKVKVTGISFRTFHIVHDEKELGRATMAKVFDETGKAIIAFSFCSPKDKYCKIKGQLIACGRLARLGKRRMLVEQPTINNIKKLLVAEAEFRKIKWLEGIDVEDIK